MKVEVDMEKISAEIAAAEEAARKRMAEREKDAGDRGAREAPTCVLAEEEKHICATHGNKSQQNSHSQSSNKQGDDTDSSTTDTQGEIHLICDLSTDCVAGVQVFNISLFLFLTQESLRPQKSLRLIQAARKEQQRTRRVSQREPWRREPVTVTQVQRPPLLRLKMPWPVSHQRGPAGPEQPTESKTWPGVNCKTHHFVCWPSSDNMYCTVSSQFVIWGAFRWAQYLTRPWQRWQTCSE